MKKTLSIFTMVLLAAVLIISCSNEAKEPEIYTVTFDSDGGSSVEGQNVLKGYKATRPVDPKKDGYAFDGWLDSESRAFDFDTKITSDITLKAMWAGYHNVTFNSNGGSKVETQKVADGRYAVLPDTPTRNGYDFRGWLFGGRTYIFEGTPVTSDITLTAQWTDSTRYYDILFDSDGGTEVKPQRLKEGEKVTKPAEPDKDGYYFDYWTLNGWEYNFNALTTSDLTLKAKWVESCTIRFDSAGGSDVESDIIKKGTMAVKPEDPTRGNDIFDGWYYNGTQFDFENTTVNETITLTAHWKTAYKVTFKTDGGSEVEPQIVEEGKYATEPAKPTKEGYSFNLWTLDGAVFDFATQAITKDIELVATWNNVSEICIVTFNSNGGYPSEIKKGVIPWSKVIRPDNPTKEGSYFVCWMHDGTVFDFDKETISENLTLYALWSTTKYYTVTFDEEGGSSVPLQRVKENNKATQPVDPKRYGYVFQGWVTDDYKEYNFNTPVTSDIILTAKWERYTHKVVFDSNGGSPVNTETVGDGDTVIKPGNPTNLSEEHKTFDYWEYDGEKFDFSTPVKFDITLKAVWRDYRVGDTGPGGGYIFYDCDADNSDENDGAGPDGLMSSKCGWRFLEAAEKDLSSPIQWGVYSEHKQYGTKTDIGTGKENTKILLNNRNSYNKSISDYVWNKDINGFTDWYVPSKDELNLMYVNLHAKGLGSFRNDVYWSSSEYYWKGSYEPYRAWAQNFSSSNDQYGENRMNKYEYVRPVRRF